MAASGESAETFSACRVHANGLTREENLALSSTNLEEETVSLILRGLKQSWDSQARSFHGRVPAT